MATLVAVPVFAQTAATPPADAASAPAKSDTVGLDRIVVTATSTVTSKLRSSVSVTDVDAVQIKNFGAHTEAEVLLLIPGIRTDATAGPGGTANSCPGAGTAVAASNLATDLVSNSAAINTLSPDMAPPARR